jgi:predicted GH43/DUF377 family glycosyl hydrolase
MTHAPFFNRHALHLRPDPSRVIVRHFSPAIEPRDHNPIDMSRAKRIIERVLALSESEVAHVLATTLENFEDHHSNLLQTLEQRGKDLAGIIRQDAQFAPSRLQLIGAYFLHEYSFEAAALFNPSIVPHPDQSGLEPGSIRFILSLRAVGEGHISSLTFRRGTICAEGEITIEPPSRLARMPLVTARLDDKVDICFSPESNITERVIFPITDAQANGIEDARFVAFEDEGNITYYATYTAYSGRAIRSELLETKDFLSFRLIPMKGSATANKGMALFPRKIGGRYVMLARYDNESLQLIFSDNLREWNLGVSLLRPEYPWEFVQIGNCGSPIELDAGWLVFTHGVGPMRHYAIGAVLLDKDNLTHVIGRSRVPLVTPAKSEREGYVPNVVYSCGAMICGDRIVLPYAISDTFSTVATVKIAKLVEILKQGVT